MGDVSESRLHTIPAGHGVGSIRPNPGQMYPLGQAVHASWPTIALNCPGGHGIGSQWPSRGQYVPTGHDRRIPVGQ